MFQPNRIIDDLDYLKELPEEELRETLLDDKYNKANLRELVRRLIADKRVLESRCERHYESRIKAEEELGTIKKQVKAIAIVLQED